MSMRVRKRKTTADVKQMQEEAAALHDKCEEGTTEAAEEVDLRDIRIEDESAGRDAEGLDYYIIYLAAVYI